MDEPAVRRFLLASRHFSATLSQIHTDQNILVIQDFAVDFYFKKSANVLPSDVTFADFPALFLLCGGDDGSMRTRLGVTGCTVYVYHVRGVVLKLPEAGGWVLTTVIGI